MALSQLDAVRGFFFFFASFSFKRDDKHLIRRWNLWKVARRE